MMAWRGCIEAHHPMAITPLEVAAPLPLDHERTASIHCAATRENTECATRASRATANADGHHATARRHQKPGKEKHGCQSEPLVPPPPTLRVTMPPRPAVATPEAKKSAPLLPDCDEPELKTSQSSAHALG